MPQYILISVDTEPDDLNWRGFHQDQLQFKNLKGLTRFKELLQKYTSKATFFLSYQTACQKLALELLPAWIKEGFCEVGSHLHPGDTPPLEGSADLSCDNILKLNNNLLEKKFLNLHEHLSKHYQEPKSFRAGAWTTSPALYRLLHQYKYVVDSSITPGISWAAIDRPSYLTFPHKVFKPFEINASHYPAPDLLEVPTSIWIRSPWSQKMGTHIGSIFTMPMESKKGLIFQLLKCLRPPRPLWLRPAFESTTHLFECAENCLKETGFIHIMCHSNELTQGTSPYTATQHGVDTFYKNLESLLIFSKKKGLTGVTLFDFIQQNNK